VAAHDRGLRGIPLSCSCESGRLLAERPRTICAERLSAAPSDREFATIQSTQSIVPRVTGT
jgi:hypothetical protein